ncbi:serine hydrolase domain-containing protein [Rhodophyticola porphyridii]|uniref:serine hydrolase domain-containing protein n=1 Tax=Rhodophyticola porphyridii TaxID=1852017 RepID=UPI0035CF6793
MTLDAAWAHAAGAVAAGRIPCAVLGVTGPGGRHVRATGLAARFPEEVPVTCDTLFDLASLTKPVFTTERILAHAEAGRIDLDAPLTSVIPDLRQYDAESWERQVTFRDCLAHRTPFPAVEPIYTYGGDPDRLRAFVLQRAWRRQAPPVYSDINFILIGIALERLEGCPIRQMDPGPGFTFAPDPETCAATEACAWRGRILRGEVHDENCFALQGAGHAGLFGTADALLGFAEDRLSGGPAPIFTALSPTRSHGWEIRHEGWSGGQNCSAATIGHTGFTGTGLWIDPEAGIAWTFLTNRVHPTRHTESGIADLRRAVGEALFAE